MVQATSFETDQCQDCEFDDRVLLHPPEAGKTHRRLNLAQKYLLAFGHQWQSQASNTDRHPEL